MGRLTISGLAAIAFALGGAGAHADGGQPEPFQPGNPAIAGVLSLPSAPAGARLPAVVVLPDALGPDGRADAYVVALNAAGLLVLEIHAEPAAESAAMAARALARDPRVLPGRIGLLGFGAGGRAALLARDPVAARATLYPGCIGLEAELARQEAAIASPILLLHGDRDAANPRAACAELVSALAIQARAERAEIAGAGYAWDRPGFGPEGPALLPRPDGVGRIRAAHDPRGHEASVAHVAAWMAHALATAGDLPHAP
jgi:dienelactone hydrolase